MIWYSHENFPIYEFNSNGDIRTRNLKENIEYYNNVKIFSSKGSTTLALIKLFSRTTNYLVDPKKFLPLKISYLKESLVLLTRDEIKEYWRVLNGEKEKSNRAFNNRKTNNS